MKRRIAVILTATMLISTAAATSVFAEGLAVPGGSTDGMPQVSGEMMPETPADNGQLAPQGQMQPDDGWQGSQDQMQPGNGW